MSIDGEPGVAFNAYFNPMSKTSPSTNKGGRRNLDLKPLMSLV